VVGRGREKGEKAAEMVRRRREQRSKEGDEVQLGFVRKVGACSGYWSETCEVDKMDKVQVVS